MSEGLFYHREVVIMGVLGRVGIPYKIRKELGIEEGDKLEIIVEGHTIIILKMLEEDKVQSSVAATVE